MEEKNKQKLNKELMALVFILFASIFHNIASVGGELRTPFITGTLPERERESERDMEVATATEVIDWWTNPPFQQRLARGRISGFISLVPNFIKFDAAVKQSESKAFPLSSPSASSRNTQV